jgi:hypothetical protein
MKRPSEKSTLLFLLWLRRTLANRMTTKKEAEGMEDNLKTISMGPDFLQFLEMSLD